MDTDKLKNNKRTNSVIELIKLYKMSNIDDKTIMLQLIDGFSRTFSKDELQFLVNSVK